MSDINQSRISDEAVKRAVDAWRRGCEDEYGDLSTTRRIRAALEASGAVFLTDDEKYALLKEICGEWIPPNERTASALNSAREKLRCLWRVDGPI